MSINNLTGQQYGELQVLGSSIISGDYIFWNCSCSCGNLRVVEAKRLLSGKVTKCMECESNTKTASEAN